MFSEMFLKLVDSGDFIVSEGTLHILVEVLDGFAQVAGLYEAVGTALFLCAALLVYGDVGELALEPLVGTVKIAEVDVAEFYGFDACNLKLSTHKGTYLFEESLLGFSEGEGIYEIGLCYGLLKPVFHRLYIFDFAFKPFVHHNCSGLLMLLKGMQS